MSSWILLLSKEAEQHLLNLDEDMRLRIWEKILWLKDNFDAITPIPMTDKWSDHFKLRIGDYRVIYKVGWGKNELIIMAVGHRSKIYKL